jgi:type II restriction enzyme
MALVCSNKPNYPLHIDRLFSAGGNTRSALETLLAYTPHFFICHPERVDAYSGEILRNLKHIMWCPDETHPLGQIVEKEYKQVITEVELGIDFDQITIGNFRPSDEFDDIEVKRTHTQMQIALIEIGRALNFRTWVAKNDRSIQVGDKTMGDMEGVIPSLESMTILHNPESKEVAKLIDCIWFTADGRRIPAGIEVEHSTGVTSGLTRMLKLRETIPAISTTFTIVAPNDLRNKVVAEANQTIFRELKARYMPYTTVRELYGLVQRYSLSNVVDHKFIYPFMEEVVED